MPRLFQQRTLWWPTRLGWLTLFLAAALPAGSWALWGEAFLSRTTRTPARVLIVEGWIGIPGIQAAKAEFDRGNYELIVAAGGRFQNKWGPQRWNYAVEAHRILRNAGVPEDRILTAPAEDTGRQRTFLSAMAVRREFERRGLSPSAVNVFTTGAHARRSRLVFAKVLASDVGVVSWTPSEYTPGRWWNNSDQAVDFIKETVGYLFELLLNSGRLSNAPPRENSRRQE